MKSTVSVFALVYALVCSHSGQAERGSNAATANPIRKVVSLLQAMAQKVDGERKKEEALYEEFLCYCKTSKADLQKSLSTNGGKPAAVQSDIDEADSSRAKLKEDLKNHRANLEAAKTAMAAASGVREKEQQGYEAEATEKKGFIASLAKTIPAVMKGMAGTHLLQTETGLATSVRRAAGADVRLTDDDRDTIMAFLAVGHEASDAYTPGSGEIIGILQNMKADYEKDLAAITGPEKEAVALYEDLIAAKDKEVKTLRASIEKKTERIGDLSIDIVNWKHDVTESEAMVAADTKMLNSLDTDCAAKTADFQERSKMQSEELLAIHDTVKILTDDDALDMFKATLPSAGASLLQNRRSQKGKAALAILKKLVDQPRGDRPEVRFLEMALMGKKVDFSKVNKLIDDMVSLLNREQADDEQKKKYCKGMLSAAADKVKDLAKSIKEQEANAGERAETLQALAEEAKTMEHEVTELDKLVADATEERKAQNAEFTELVSGNNAATEVLKFAKQRLGEFYNPEGGKKQLGLAVMKAHVASSDDVKFPDSASPLTQLEEGHAKVEPWRAPDSLLKVLDARPHLPAQFSATALLQHRVQDSNRVLAVLDQLIHDLSLETKMAEKDEEHAQSSYEGLMSDSARKRATYVKSINVKESAKADNEELQTKEAGALSSSNQEYEASQVYKQTLHAECDWMLENYDLRRTARADEVDNLQKAKAVLAGADFSLVQSPMFLSRRLRA